MRETIKRLREWQHRRRMRRTACTAGGWAHAPLVWQRATRRHEQQVASRGEASEILVASGFMRIANWIGVCPACSQPVEWSTDHPNQWRKHAR